MRPLRAPVEIRSLPHQAELLQSILDASTEAVWGLDLAGNCTFINHSATNSLGFTAKELIGHNMHRLTHHHYPDGRQFEEQDCPINVVLLKGKPVRELHQTLYRKDGKGFLAQVSAKPVIVQGRIVGAVVTFSERQESYAEADLDAILESASQGIYVVHRDGRVRMNRRAREMNGGDFPRELHTLDKAMAGQPSTEVMRVANRWIESTGGPIRHQGAIIGGIAINTDVTQSRLQDEALRKSEKLAAMGQLASSIAHEINNPLESITNLLYLMRHSNSIGEIQSYAQLAQEELKRVTDITLQTLRFHRQQTKTSPVDLAELLRTLMTLYTGRLLVRGISVEMRLREAPPVVALDGELRQVINNLVRNALDAMEGGGGRLLLRLSPRCNWKVMRQGVSLTVADTGEGIGLAMKRHLFEPFHTTKEHTGTGLGLWVSKGIIEKHGGTIRVRSRQGAEHGTVFSIWLPLDGAEREFATIPVVEG